MKELIQIIPQHIPGVWSANISRLLERAGDFTLSQEVHCPTFQGLVDSVMILARKAGLTDVKAYADQTAPWIKVEFEPVNKPLPVREEAKPPSKFIELPGNNLLRLDSVQFVFALTPLPNESDWMIGITTNFCGTSQSLHISYPTQVDRDAAYQTLRAALLNL